MMNDPKIQINTIYLQKVKKHFYVSNYNLQIKLKLSEFQLS